MIKYVLCVLTYINGHRNKIDIPELNADNFNLDFPRHSDKMESRYRERESPQERRKENEEDKNKRRSV